MRTGGRVIPRRDEMVSVVEWEECNASTDSRKLSVAGVNAGMRSVVSEEPLRGIWACELVTPGRDELSVIPGGSPGL